MFQVLRDSAALLLGMFLLMLGNGLQGTLLGVRGGLEGFSTFEMSLVMSAYFVGFLGGSRLAPGLIRRVGHVRVFAALGSLISAILILFPTVVEPWAWIALRVLIGFCFSGVYVTAESWLNNAASNENRGKSLSLYMIVQMAGIVTAQGVLALGDPSGFVIFIIPSVLVSLAFAPILLSVSPTPAFETTKPLSLRQLYAISPLACVGMFLTGGVYSAQFGMAAVYGGLAGLDLAEISAFVASFYLGALVLQYPVGWISDRVDRRQLILGLAVAGGLFAVAASFVPGFLLLLVAGFAVGGMSNPLYALMIAYANDYLEREDMAAASGGLLFINGVGAILGPLLIGWSMAVFGPVGFFFYVAALMFGLGAYAGWRMTRRPARPGSEETVSYAPVMPTSGPVALEVATEMYIEAETEQAEAAEAAVEAQAGTEDAAAGGSRGPSG